MKILERSDLSWKTNRLAENGNTRAMSNLDIGKTFDEITARYFQSGYDDMNQANEYFDAVEKICNFTMPKEIAEIFLEGKGGVQPDGYKALEYLAQTLEGINKAIELTKNFVASNEDVEQNYPGILKRFFDRSESRLKNAYKQIAEIYRCGKCGVLPDGQKALALYERLDEIELLGGKNKVHFESTALFRIVDIYAKGCGSVQIDGRRAVEYLIQAIERGYLCAFHWLKELYNEEKIDIEVYGHKLIGYFLEYAQKKCNSITDEEDDFLFITKNEIAESFKIVAQIYFKLNDIPKALEYFLKADEYGDSWAYIDVAKIYRNGGANFKADGEKLLEFLTKKLAKEERPDSSIIYDIAEIYEEGCGSLEPDIKKALEFYRKAAELGNTFAEKKLSDLTGEGKIF